MNNLRCLGVTGRLEQSRGRTTDGGELGVGGTGAPALVSNVVPGKRVSADTMKFDYPDGPNLTIGVLRSEKPFLAVVGGSVVKTEEVGSERCSIRRVSTRRGRLWKRRQGHEPRNGKASSSWKRQGNGFPPRASRKV